MAVDKNGKEVKVGSLVKVLNIDPGITKVLLEKETKDVLSMVGDVLKVYEVSSEYASVEKIWDRGNGKTESHSLSLSAQEMELIQ